MSLRSRCVCAREPSCTALARLLRFLAGNRSENGFPPGKDKHGPGQDIPAPWCIVRFFEIPVERSSVEESLEWPLIERRVGHAPQKLGAKADERPGCPKHAGAFECLRERRVHA
jgi:hypothetical protein